MPARARGIEYGMFSLSHRYAHVLITHVLITYCTYSLFKSLLRENFIKLCIYTVQVFFSIVRGSISDTA